MRLLFVASLFVMLSACSHYEWQSKHERLPYFSQDQNECAYLAETTDKFYNGSFLDSRVFHDCMRKHGHNYVSVISDAPSPDYVQGVFNTMTIMNSF